MELVRVGRDWLSAVAEATREISEGKARPSRRATASAGRAGKRSMTAALVVHRKAETDPRIADDSAARLRAAQEGRGEPLPADLATELAASLGVTPDVLAGVRIHVGSASADAAEAISARAYTVGTDIHFAPGAYAPDSEQGRRLIAHEVAHAVAAPVASLADDEVQISDPAESHEQAADAFADSFVEQRRAREDDDGERVEAAPIARAPALAAGGRAAVHRFEGELSEEERKRRKRKKGGDAADAANGGPDAAAPQAPGAAPGATADAAQDPNAAGPAGAAPAGGPAAGGAAPAAAAPDAAPGAAAPASAPAAEPARGSSPVDQAVASAGGDAPQKAAENARARDGGAAPAEGGPAPADGAAAPAGAAPAGAAPPGAAPADAPAAPAAGGAAPQQEGADADGPAAPAGQAQGDGAAAPAAGGGPVDFKEPNYDQLVPAEPDESPEEREERVAEARQQVAQDKAVAVARLGEFRAAQGEKIAALAQTAPQIDQALTASEQRAAAQVSQAAAAQAAAVRSAVAQAISQAQAAAATARSQIQSAFAAAQGAINAATTAARGQITSSYTTAVAATRTAETAQIAEVSRLYTQAEGAFRSAATAAGSHATTVAGGRARTYRAGKINRDDSFLDGPLTDNRCEARAEAAEKVGTAYRDELAKEGDKQIEQMRTRKPTDEAAVRQVANEARRNLETAQREALRGLDDSSRRALASAAQARDGALTGTTRTLTDTVNSLRRHEQTQIANINQTAAGQKQALTRQRTQASTQLREMVSKAVTDLTTGLDQSIAAVRSADVPEPAALDQTLGESGAAIDGQLAQFRATLTGTQTQIGEALTQAGARGAQALAQTGTTAAGAARQMGGGAAGAIAQGAQQAAKSLTDMSTAHGRSTTELAAGTARGFTGITAGLSTAYTNLNTSLQQGMQRNADAVRNGLMEVVNRDMGATITTEADAAAAKVKPRWQSVLKWIIIIAIVLVVAIFLGPLVIGAITGLAAGLGASAAVAGVVGAVVGGAIVGAGTAAVTTVVDNAFAGRTGWDLFTGVGTAMAWGALGGALGGGASALLAGPMQGMTALARYGIQVGVDMVIDTGISALSGNLSWENFGTSLLMSMFVNGVTMHPRVQLASQRSMSRGYGAGFEVGVGARARMPGATPVPGPTSMPPGKMDHVARGDTSPPGSPNAGNWNVKGGGHIPGEIIPRADAEGRPHTTQATDPVTGVSIERFNRPPPSTATTDKSLFPPGTTRPQVDAMGNTGLQRALSGAPGSTHTPPTAPGQNGRFTATVMGPNGHPIIIEGFYKPVAGGGFEIQSVYPSTNLGAGTIPVAGGTGLGGSRSVPGPGYATPPATSEDR